MISGNTLDVASRKELRPKSRSEAQLSREFGIGHVAAAPIRTQSFLKLSELLVSCLLSALLLLTATQQLNRYWAYQVSLLMYDKIRVKN